jgi:hypothetical protein
MESNYPLCPKCGGNHFKVSKLPDPLVLHYVLNPGIAVSEVLLGLCCPKITLYCQTCQLPLYARTYVPCPHCRTMHDARLWSKGRVFGNWRGYICPNCKQRIPRLWNVFSLLILIVLAPIWYFPYRFFYRNYRRRSRAANISTAIISNPTKKTWIFMGASFAWFMWLFMSLIPAVIQFAKTQVFPFSVVLTDLVIYGISGFCFGLLMYLILSKKPK